MKKLMLPLALLLSQATLAKVEVSGFITPSLKFGSDSASDSYEKTLEMIDAGVTFEGEIKENLSATIALLADQENLDQADAFSLVDEAYMTQKWSNGLSLKAGRSYLNFGNFDTAFITDTTTLSFGEIQTNLVELGHEYNGLNYAVYAYNTSADHVEAGDKAGLNSYGATASYERDNLMVGASYLSNIAPTALYEFDNSQLKKVVGAYSIFGKVNMHGLGIYASYMSGLKNFNKEDASYVTGEKKFNPMALNIEASYAHELMGKEWTVALGYQKQEGVANDLLLPSTILLAGLSVAVDEKATVALEYRHAMDKKTSDGGATDEKEAGKTTLAYQLSF